MLKIKISAALEKEIRGGFCSGPKLREILVQLIDEARAISVSEKEKGKVPGLSYSRLVQLFRAELGADLSLPINPTAGWIVKLVNRAKELGIGEEHVGRICAGAKEAHRAPYAIEYLINHSGRLLHTHHRDIRDRQEETGSEDQVGPDREATKVVTGRPRDGSSE